METQVESLSVERAVKHIFDEELHLTTITEFGVSWDDLLTGSARLPYQGARFDLAFEGKLTGPEIRGTIKGVDYLEVRADGKFQLNIQAIVVTDDGEAIALKEDGILTPSPNGPARLHLNMQFSTAAARYQWINARQMWGVGEVDMQSGTVAVRGYSS